MRTEYILHWNLPHVQKVLASASNLMMWGEGDIYPNFTHDLRFFINRQEPTKEVR